MKKILFLVDYYLENTSPNGICCQKVAKELTEHGYEVSVVSYRPIGTKNIEVVDGVKLYTCYEYGLDEISSKKKFSTKVFEYIKWSNPFSKYPIFYKRKLVNSIYTIASQVIESNDIDAVVSVYLPVDTMIATLRLKKEYPTIDFYAYMLDSLSGGILPRFLPGRYLRWKRLLWEDKLMNCYKKVILMESSYKHHEEASYNKNWYKAATYLNIPMFACPDTRGNGISKKEWSRNIHIAFVGTMGEGVRTPYRFLSILSYVHGINITVSFTGINRCRYNIQKTIGKNIEVEINKPVSHQEATQIIVQADVVLNLGNETPVLVPSKIFEYMSYGKPIISTYSIDDDGCIPYLKKYPLALLIDERKPLETEAEKIVDFINLTLQKKVDFSELNEAFYTSSPKAFRETLENDYA